MLVGDICIREVIQCEPTTSTLDSAQIRRPELVGVGERDTIHETAELTQCPAASARHRGSNESLIRA